MTKHFIFQSVALGKKETTDWTEKKQQYIGMGVKEGRGRRGVGGARRLDRLARTAAAPPEVLEVVSDGKLSFCTIQTARDQENRARLQMVYFTNIEKKK